MKDKKQQLIIEQIDRKLVPYNSVDNIIAPSKGWLNAVRSSLNMTLQQLGNRLNITPQSARDLEAREAAGNITINTLRQAAQALDMKLVYGLVPKDGSIAEELARKIVLRTSQSMKLENQEISSDKIEKAIQEKADELKDKLPKYLWE
jgi:predicted DNA-binding mobile mystery protein A